MNDLTREKIEQDAGPLDWFGIDLTPPGENQPRDQAHADRILYRRLESERFCLLEEVKQIVDKQRALLKAHRMTHGEAMHY